MEWGDTGRIESYLGHLSAGRRGELLESSFEELDLFLKGLLAEPNFDGRLLIAVPSPPQTSVVGGYRLTPVVYYNPGNPRGGLLISKTTRVPGIVANIDIAPSVVEHFGLASPVYLGGAPLGSEPSDGHLQRISAWQSRRPGRTCSVLRL